VTPCTHCYRGRVTSSAVVAHHIGLVPSWYCSDASTDEVRDTALQVSVASGAMMLSSSCYPCSSCGCGLSHAEDGLAAASLSTTDFERAAAAGARLSQRGCGPVAFMYTPGAPAALTPAARESTDCDHREGSRPATGGTVAASTVMVMYDRWAERYEAGNWLNDALIEFHHRFGVMCSV
jgi:hypothetical protein